MRRGINQSKVAPEIFQTSYHRVIVPVHIPNLDEEYYKDGLQILEFNLVSLLRTIHNKTRVSVINNGCCDEIVAFLNELKSKYDSFDQLYDSESNLGKINAVFGVVRSTIEPLLTITDADVLFLEGWQEQVENVFSKFPKAGMVSPVPSSIGYENPNASATLGYAVLSSKFIFSAIQDDEGLLKFQESIGRTMYQEAHLTQWPVISSKDGQAVIGCGHFCSTIKRNALVLIPSFPTVYKLGMGTDAQYIDRPINKAGYLRLATTENLAYHLGNVAEEWMHAAMPNPDYTAEAGDKKFLNLEEAGVPQHVRWLGVILIKLFKRMKSIKIWYFKRRGLDFNYY